MPKHTKTQPSSGESIPGASKAWMSHFKPSSNGRIIRVRLNDTNYLAYAPELLCRLTRWHNLHGGACQHGNADPVYARWPCASRDEGYHGPGNPLENPARRIALVPWPKAPFGLTTKDLEGQGVKFENWWAPVASTVGHEKKRMGKQFARGEEKFSHELLENATRALEEREEARRTKIKQKMVDEEANGKKIRRRGKDELMLRFAHADLLPGRDDPVEDGRELAFSGDSLPSDGTWRRSGGDWSGARVRLGTEEEKELADLRKQGLLKDIEGEDMLTLNSIVRENEPVYRVKFVQKKKGGGERKGRTEVVQTQGERSEEQLSVASSDVVPEGIQPALDADRGLELLPQEVIDAMPDHCWAEFFADLEAEGWVPVIEDDLASVAESWVVMESDSEDSDGET